MKKLMFLLLVCTLLFIFSFNTYAQNYNQRYQLFETKNKHNSEYRLILLDTQTGNVWYFDTASYYPYWRFMPFPVIREVPKKEK